MHKFLLFLSASCFPVAAAAQDADPAEQVLDEVAESHDQGAEPREEEIVFWHEASSPITVTANGLSTNIDNTGQAVTVIERDEIEAVQGGDIARVLRRAPGVTIGRNGPVGSFTGINVRGANAEQLLVLIDGVRVSDPAAPTGGFDFGNLLTGNIGKIDLLRGSNSTIWGSDAVGGVLDLSLRGEAGIEGSLEYGARDTVLASASGAVDRQGFFGRLSASWFSTDGFSAAASGSEPDGFEQLSLGGAAYLDLSDRLELFAHGRYAEGDLDIDGFPAPAFVLADTLETQETTQFSGATGLAYYGQDLTLRGSFSFAETQRTNFDPAVGPTFASEGQSERLALRGEYRLIGGLVLAFGGEHEWARYETLFDAGADTESTGGYLQLGWVLGGLAAHVGARVDDHQGFGSATSFGGDVSYALAGGWRLRASLGEGFKAPSLFQLFSDFGNSALRPEKSTSFDIGVEKGTRGRGTHFALTGFRRDSEDLIGFISCFGSTDPICVGRLFGTYDNTARARAQGIEAEAGFAVTERLRLSGVFSLVDAEDRQTGLELARRPDYAATFFADYTAPFGLGLGADLRVVSDSFDDGANAFRLDGHELLDLRASFPLSDAVEIFGRVENVFDAEYQTALGYAQAGRGAFIGIRAGL
ncbi:MAG: TonB-dependent receptor plug domain-containing protein [Qipengyuania sp.]